MKTYPVSILFAHKAMMNWQNKHKDLFNFVDKKINDAIEEGHFHVDLKQSELDEIEENVPTSELMVFLRYHGLTVNTQTESEESFVIVSWITSSSSVTDIEVLPDEQVVLKHPCSIVYGR